jgi:hypothetical protein
MDFGVSSVERYELLRTVIWTIGPSVFLRSYNPLIYPIMPFGEKVTGPATFFLQFNLRFRTSSLRGKLFGAAKLNKWLCGFMVGMVLWLDGL